MLELYEQIDHVGQGPHVLTLVHVAGDKGDSFLVVAVAQGQRQVQEDAGAIFQIVSVHFFRDNFGKILLVNSLSPQREADIQQYPVEIREIFPVVQIFKGAFQIFLYDHLVQPEIFFPACLQRGPVALVLVEIFHPQKPHHRLPLLYMILRSNAILTPYTLSAEIPDVIPTSSAP